MINNANTIYSPQMLWKDFDSALPLKESVVSEEVFDNVVYKNIYFSGRETGDGRVRINGMYAQTVSKGRRNSRGGLLIIPDYNETVNAELVGIYVKQGYNVLMIDYRGQFEGCEDFTKYPDCISYANFDRAGRALDFADITAKETCWYEWNAVMKYAVSFLKEQQDINKVGVLGIKNGANLGWMLCGTDFRVDCFVALFGAGWRAYRGKFKNSDENDIEKNEERIRFLAGVDVQAYAKNVECPVLYQTSTNNPDFDIDRSVDTILRVPESETDFKTRKVKKSYERFNNYAPRLREVLDRQCAKNIDLFLGKHLNNQKIYFPSEPKLTVNVEGKNMTAELEIDLGETKKTRRVTVFVSEGIENPAFRDWNEMTEAKGKTEEVKQFSYRLNGNSSFINAFGLVEFRNGITLSTKILTRKIELVKVRDKQLIYSANDKTGSFSVYNVKKQSQGGLFFKDDNYITFAEGSDGISGACSKYGLISYKVNNRFIRLNERSFIKLDVYCEEFSAINLVLMTVEEGVTKNYIARVKIKGGDIWQNLLIKCTEFKSEIGRPIKDYSLVMAMRIETESKCIINNILLI